MLPPFVHDTLAWIRSETILSAGAAPSPAGEAPAADTGAYAAPMAAAIAGAFGAGALILFWSLGLPPLAVAAVSLAALAAITGVRFESGIVRAGDKFSGRAGVGTAALLFLLLAEIAALDGLIALHAPSATLALIAAVVLGFAASIAFRLTQPSFQAANVEETERRAPNSGLQGLMVITIVLAAVMLLPVFRIGPTAAGFVAAVAGFVAVVALTKNQITADVPDNSFAAGKVAEVAALLAILAFSRTS